MSMIGRHLILVRMDHRHVRDESLTSRYESAAFI
jgi:hypothetical protein